MKLKRSLLALGIGTVVGVVAWKQISDKQQLSPEKALKLAKESFKRQGPISGSWIHMKTEEFSSDDLPYTVYRGGVSRSLDGQTKQYEFYMDAVTGTILDVSVVA
ncbi:peptidase M4 [Pontibacillus chungwhensis BH030062]|uniref:Peptidase M4 n=2 Tax=Pontibacillus TaxID=289201 RepID=A0A0A2UPG2_9BACI|nr:MULTISPECIES: PepSY domain-containing protein [Pontibacillus]KGP90192.1 peptidase M4 [Pontibacillus chungwhensis BH030062]QSS99283.1 PepSY domain-containing protein [Pontibacillus sp. ALD_SL1]GGD17398.1 peptidase M4 [Pontibacillus salipaludis]